MLLYPRLANLGVDPAAIQAIVDEVINAFDPSQCIECRRCCLVALRNKSDRVAFATYSWVRETRKAVQRRLKIQSSLFPMRTVAAAGLEIATGCFGLARD